MLKNYLKVAVRNIRRHPGYAFINIVGLGFGIACSLLIMLFVVDELSFDRYHEKADHIYRLINSFEDDDFDGIAKVNGPWGLTANSELPEVENVTRFVILGQSLMGEGEQQAYQSGGLYADSTVFELFDFKLRSGDPRTALTRPNTIVIDPSLAEAYFGDEDPVGQSIHMDFSDPNNPPGPYTVTGVLASVPAQSHFTFRYLVSLSSYYHPDREDWIRWNQFYTYLLLREDADPEVVAEKFNALLPQYMSAEQVESNTAALQSLTSIHLRSNLFRELSVNGNLSNIYIFSVIAIIILLIACINFINLSTARSASRAKEVGVRKTAGAYRFSLVKQFLSESMLFSVLAILLAVQLVSLGLAQFNELTGKALSMSELTQPVFLLSLLGIMVVVGFISGSYPALVISRFKPVQALKGKAKGGGNSVFRKGLVVFQFAVSIILILATGVVFEQLQYMQNKSLGFNKDQLINIPIRDNGIKENMASIKDELKRHPGITEVAFSGNLPGGGDWGIPTEPEGVPDEERPSIRMLAVDHDFINVFEMEVVQGRAFDPSFSTDTDTYILNEEAARQLNWDDPLSKTIAMPAVDRPRAAVVGVLKDFHFRSMHEEIGPIMLFIPPPNWFSIVTVRFRPEQTGEVLAFLEDQWKTYDPGHPFTYSFFDQQYGRLHQAEAQMAQLINRFAFIAVLIACLGLFGLAVFTAEQRTKEIGIRKVLGASIPGIIGLLSRDFTRLVLVAFVVACPLAYLLTDSWLEGFAYRAEIGVRLYAVAGGVALLIAWITVSYQSIKAAFSNPVDALRYE